MRDFTLRTYRRLLEALMRQGYKFCTFSQSLESPPDKYIVLRHDVDMIPRNSLIFAQLQNELGIRGTYYFRAVPESMNPEIIKEISSLGHEVGYHYEDVTMAWEMMTRRQRRQLMRRADYGEVLAGRGIELFRSHLADLLKLVPVTTACMHGSPLSRWDSRLMWRYFDYKELGITGEPYFDVNYNEVLYLTDTGRRWNGSSVSIRDKVLSGGDQVRSPGQQLKLSTTFNIIEATEGGMMPDKILITIHPQRWADRFDIWLTELIYQNLKNSVKYFIVIVDNK